MYTNLKNMLTFAVTLCRVSVILICNSSGHTRLRFSQCWCWLLIYS